MTNLFNLFIVGIAFCFTVAANDVYTDDLRKIINQTVVVEVEIDLPWFIHFKIPLFENFEPQRFSVNLKHINESDPYPVGFNTHNDTEGRRIFRNTDPLRLYEGDIIYVFLGYMGDLRKRREETELKHVDFSYVINNKQFDTITIVVEVLSQLRTKLNEEDEDCDCTEQNIKPTVGESDIAVTGMKTAEKSIIATATTSLSTETTTLPSWETTTWASVGKQQQLTSASCTSRENEDGYTAELLRTAEEIGQIGTRLLLKGNNKSPGSNAVDVIKMFLMDKLHLPHVKVLQARFIQAKVLFEVETPHAKLEVLTKARLCLNWKNRIESTELSFIDTQSKL